MDNTVTPHLSCPQASDSLLNWALYWFRFGFKVVPIRPQTKIPAVKFDGWLDSLNEAKIIQYWLKNPNHELACLLDKDTLVLDADTAESAKVIQDIEERFGITPLLRVATAKGCHHYFSVPPSVYVKSDSHCTSQFPERIDVRAERSMAMLPPSTGKHIEVFTVQNKSDLMPVSQEMVDTIFIHNERSVPRPNAPLVNRTYVDEEQGGTTPIHVLRDLLEYIDPDVGYQDWTNVMMAIFHETAGSDAGLALADEWSSKGEKYRGISELQIKWDSFDLNFATPITIRTIQKMAGANGADTLSILSRATEFEPCEYEVIPYGGPATTKALATATPDESEVQKTTPAAPVQSTVVNPLAKFSLRDKVEDLEKLQSNKRYILKDIALMGQATVLFAAPGTGKTLLCLHLIFEAIRNGTVDPEKVCYLDFDDNLNGLTDKTRLAAEHGIHVLSDGHAGFSLPRFIEEIQETIKNGAASGMVLVLDTLKKFADQTNKRESSDFNKLMRQFTLAGGTVVALGHTNKNPGTNGKSVHAGTSDIVEDFDCAYMIEKISDEAGVITVQFERKKSRGSVVDKVAYQYVNTRGCTYEELLLSVTEIQPDVLDQRQVKAAMVRDDEIIQVTKTEISGGALGKMSLVANISKQTGSSRAKVLAVLDKYTGSDPAKHFWSETRRAKGEIVYSLLESTVVADRATDLVVVEEDFADADF
ncbi:MAG TPA: PriCT-2 domain-containing protein [Burkholderiaceae bacterium]|nr:PriCT-2 domain-containing protein [Burkholderiaceae bacterium]